MTVDNPPLTSILLTIDISWLPFYTPWRHQKTFGFLVFSGGIKLELWLKSYGVKQDGVIWSLEGFLSNLNLIKHESQLNTSVNHFLTLTLLSLTLTLSWRRPLPYRNQSTDLLRKSMDWFLLDNGLRHERVKKKKKEKNPHLQASFFSTTKEKIKHVTGYT